MMQSNLYKKNEIFRKEIRRSQIESYKERIRYKFIEDSNAEEHSQVQQFQHQRQTHYLNILNYHTYSNLVLMSKEQLDNHMQMLIEIIFSESNVNFISFVDHVLTVLVDYYEESFRFISENTLNELKSKGFMLQDPVQLSEMVEIVSMNKLFTFIDPNRLNKIFAGIFYEIKPQGNMKYLNKVIAIVIKQVQYIYKQTFQLKNMLNALSTSRNQSNFNPKSIETSILMTILMNISYSQNEQIIKTLMSHHVYETLQGIVQTFGMDINSLQNIAGLYYNSIQYLFDASIQLYNKKSEQHQQTETFQPEESKDNYLCISLFDQLTNHSQVNILQRMTRVSTYILKAIPQLSLNEEYITNLVMNIIRNILTQNNYIDGSERLFIQFASAKDFSQDTFYQSITQFLEIIINHQNKAFYHANMNKYRMRQDQYDQGRDNNKTVTHIRELIQSCEGILNKNCHIVNNQLVEFYKQLVQTLFDFWNKEELLNGQPQFLRLIRRAIETNQQLAKYIIFQTFQQETTQLILVSIQKQLQNQQILLLILKVLCFIQASTQPKQQRQYFQACTYQWAKIKCYIEAFLLKTEIQCFGAMGLQTLQFMLKLLEKNDI